MRVLLVNPPIYDFTAYDFWLRPYGLLRVAGNLRSASTGGQAEIKCFDYMVSSEQDRWGRGRFQDQVIQKPTIYSNIRRKFHRFGIDRQEFQKFLQNEEHFDFVLVQTIMTYWYLGLKEVIEDARTFQPSAKIILGGVYATLCHDHAKQLGVDLAIDGNNLSPLWSYLNIKPANDVPLWEMWPHRNVGIIKITEGCPFKCTYCSVPQVYPKFFGRPIEETMDEIRHLHELGIKNIAFYDDALLFKPDKILLPFLDKVLEHEFDFNFHTPNALNARFITPELAELMVSSGFKNFYLGFESSAYTWQRKTGGKVYSEEFEQAVRYLQEAGAETGSITAYLIIGHPESDLQDIEPSMHFASELGVRLMLSEFSPIPRTPDGEMCRKQIDLDNPLTHNKTYFTAKSLGEEKVNKLKQMCRCLNKHMSITAQI